MQIFRLSRPIVHYSEDDSTCDDLESEYEIDGNDIPFGALDDIDCPAAVDVNLDIEQPVNDDAKLLKKGIASVDITVQSKRLDEGTEGVYDPELDGYEYEDSDIPDYVRSLFRYVNEYQPRELDIDYRLKTFLPKFCPAVGDVDAMLKVTIPDLPRDLSSHPSLVIPESLTELGIRRLDEPNGEQSSPALLHMRLRDRLNAPATPAGKAPNAIAKGPRDIDKWIEEVARMRTARITERGATCGTPPEVSINKNVLTAYLEPYAPRVRRALDTMGPGASGNAFPSASTLDCSLSTYAKIVCALLDVPIEPPGDLTEHIKALHSLFSMYCIVKSDPRMYDS